MKYANFRTFVIAVLLCTFLAACGGSDDGGGDLANIQVFKADSPYHDVIESCVKAENCSLTTLPILGMDFNDPGIPQIMDRLVVSHTWMGERFEALLYEMPEEMLPLFKGVTAIVIDDDIRPAYYTTSTGAIYLDPAFLWLSVDEKRTINPKQDYRAGFDDPLAFRQLNRYLKDGREAYKWASLTDNSTRELEDILLLAARLLLHELAHANDFFPPDAYDEINPSMTVPDAARALSGQWISTRLTETTPLLSATMYSLADVMYSGATPTISDLEITASEVGDAFGPDGAADDYGYTTAFEDLAMLFETTAMKYLFDADFELAFTSVPENPIYCDNYQIGWGVRNRVGHEDVALRARFAAERLMPELNFEDFFANLETPTEISGDWCIPEASDQQKIQSKIVNQADKLRPYL